MNDTDTALRNRFYDVARDFLDTHAPDLSTEEPPDGWANLDASGEGGSQAHRAHVALVEMLVGVFTQGRAEASVALSIDDADVAEYLARAGLRCAGGEMACYAGDEDFIEAHAEPGSIGAELAERLDRPGPREVLVVAGATDLRGVPERLALPEGRAYVMVLADDDPIVSQLRTPEPMSMSVSVLPSSDGVTPSTHDLYGGPFLGSPVPEPEVRLPPDWRERRTANEDCDEGEPYDPAEHGRETGLGWVSDPPPDEDCDGGGS